MNVKSNIRQRRQERIRALQRNHTDETMPAAYPNPEPVALLGSSGHENTERENKSLEWEERMKDPEFVWKLKQKELFEGSDGTSRGPYSAQADLPSDDRPPSSLMRRFIIRCLLSGAVFLILLGVFQIQHPVTEQARHWVERSLTEEINFNSIALWYHSKFAGSPSFLPAFRSKKGQEAEKAHSPVLGHFAIPVKGEIVKAFSENSPWVEIETSDEAPVLSMASGRVSFSGYLEETGYTLVVQHTGGVSSIYGYLRENRWQANDWIESGEIIGHTQPSGGKWEKTLYFAVKTEDKAINPAEVVAFD